MYSTTQDSLNDYLTPPGSPGSEDLLLILLVIIHRKIVLFMIMILWNLMSTFSPFPPITFSNCDEKYDSPF